MVPPESPRGLISLNSGMEVLNGRWFILAISQPPLRERVSDLFARGDCSSGGKGQEGGWAQNFPSFEPMVLVHYHFFEIVVGNLQPAVSGKAPDSMKMSGMSS